MAMFLVLRLVLCSALFSYCMHPTSARRRCRHCRQLGLVMGRANKQRKILIRSDGWHVGLEIYANRFRNLTSCNTGVLENYLFFF